MSDSRKPVFDIPDDQMRTHIIIERIRIHQERKRKREEGQSQSFGGHKGTTGVEDVPPRAYPVRSYVATPLK